MVVAGLDLSHNGSKGGSVLFLCVIDAGAVLAADVVTLAVEAGGIDDFEVLFSEGLQADYTGVVADVDGFGVACLLGANLLVGGVGGKPIGIPRGDVKDTGDAGEVFFNAPKASACKVAVLKVLRGGSRGSRMECHGGLVLSVLCG